jgi:hypothetical protein
MSIVTRQGNTHILYTRTRGIRDPFEFVALACFSAFSSPLRLNQRIGEPFPLQPLKVTPIPIGRLRCHYNLLAHPNKFYRTSRQTISTTSSSHTSPKELRCPLISPILTLYGILYPPLRVHPHVRFPSLIIKAMALSLPTMLSAFQSLIPQPRAFIDTSPPPPRS